MLKITVLEKVYGFPLHILIGKYKEYNKYCCKRYGLNEPQTNFGGESFIVQSDDSGHWDAIIWLPHFSIHNIMDIASLAHECLHIALRIAGKTGIPVEEERSEPLTYLYEFYFRESLLKLSK